MTKSIPKDCVLDRFIRLNGGIKAEAARQLDVTRQMFDGWCTRGYIPAHYAIDVERATGGAILAKQVVAEAKEALARASTNRGRRRPR